MKWHHVQDNWASFYEAISDRWPEVEEAQLDEIDGDSKAFVAYIAELTEQEPGDAREEVLEWLRGELPSDVVMDPAHDDHSIQNAAKYLPEGEDEYDDDARYGDDDEDNED